MNIRFLIFSALVVAAVTGCGTAVNTSSDAETAPDDSDATEETYICTNPVPAPVPTIPISGFTGAEDFAFDRNGNVASNDAGNLILQKKDGSKTLLVPNIGQDTSGIAFLPSGDIVICDSGKGELVRIFENGSLQTVLSGLNYPNGIEVDPDGFVYVSEQSAGRVRRIDPDTGEFQVIASDLFNPNGLAFDKDYSTLFVTSFGGGTVHSITRTGTDWERAFFGVVPGNADPVKNCEGMTEGAECQGPAGAGPGKCLMKAGLLECIVSNPCEGKSRGDECRIWDQIGRCDEEVPGFLECLLPDPCDGKKEGDACSLLGFPGTCKTTESALECQSSGPCDNRQEGDPCDSYGYPGVCTSTQYGMDCIPSDPCNGKSVGDFCESWGAAGVCETIEGLLSCSIPPACEGKIAGESCTEYGQEGTCEIGGDQVSYCMPIPPCQGDPAGSECTLFGTPGVCRINGESIYCEPEGACEGQPEGGYCFVFNSEGICTTVEDGFHCIPFQPCADKAPGDRCSSWGMTGKCTDDDTGVLYCEVAEPSEGGGIDGIAVDYCGRIYITEYTTGKIFRFDTGSNQPELIIETGRSWIPNLHFGSGTGGWDAQSVYVMVRDDSSILEVALGVPGVPDPYLNSGGL